MGNLLHLFHRTGLLALLFTFIVTWSAVRASPLAQWRPAMGFVAAQNEADDEDLYGDDDEDGYVDGIYGESDQYSYGEEGDDESDEVGY